jgi:hypothetical protein
MLKISRGLCVLGENHREVVYFSKKEEEERITQ